MKTAFSRLSILFLMILALTACGGGGGGDGPIGSSSSSNLSSNEAATGGSGSTSSESSGSGAAAALTDSASNSGGSVTITMLSSSSVSRAITGTSTREVSGSNTATLVATVLDQNGQPIEGVIVDFGSTWGVVEPDSGLRLTNAEGQAEITLRAIDKAGAGTATAEIVLGGEVLKVGINYTDEGDGLPPGQNEKVTVRLLKSNGEEVSEVGGTNNPVRIVAEVTDSGGTGASGRLVTFTTSLGSLDAGSAVTDSDGLAEVDLSAGDVNGAGTVTVTAEDASGAASLVDVVHFASSGSQAMTVGALSVSSDLESLVANGLSTSNAVISATVLDINNQPAIGVAVTFSDLTTALGGSLSALNSGVTDANGVARAVYLAGKTSGTAEVSASAGGFVRGARISLLAGPVTNVAVLAAPDSLNVDSSAQVTATLTDTNGNLVAGETVSFSMSGPNNQSGGSVEASAVTNALGVATVTYTAGSSAGSDTVTATVSNGQSGSDVITVANSAAAVESVSLFVGTSSLVADGASTTVVRATVMDASLRPVSGKTVAFTTSGGSFQGAVNTDETDAQGVAEVTLVAPANLGGAVLSSYSDGVWSGTKSVSFVAGPATSLALTATPTNIGYGAQAALQIVLEDKDGNPVEGEVVSLSVDPNASGGQLTSLQVTTDANGRASANYTAGFSDGTDTISAETAQLAAVTQNIGVNSANIQLGSLVLVEPNGSGAIVANGSSFTLLRATLKDTANNPVAGVDIGFTTSAGDFDSASSGMLSGSVTTDENGVAEIDLYSEAQLEKATVIASVGGFNQSVDIAFVAGPADSGNSSITTSPSTLPADGASSSTVSVVLVDASGNILPDGTTVTLVTDNGTVSTTNPVATSSGRADFTLVAPSREGVANLSIAELAGLTGGLTFGSTANNEAANIQLSVAAPSLSVAGVGQTENTAINIQVVEADGAPIDETNWGALDNTVRVSFVTSPNGGEYLSGTGHVDAVSSTLETQTAEAGESIDVRTVNGSAQVNLQAGTLPGVVEIRVEALQPGGLSYSPAIVASVPQVSIASGPAHTIVLSYPITNAVENLNDATPQVPGFYRRSGAATVTDRYGNAVADGTAINLGMIDSVIVEGITGVTDTAQDPGVFTDLTPYLSNDPGTPVDFLAAEITRNATRRLVQPNDRVLVFNAQAEDKNRFVTTVAQSELGVQSVYRNDASNLSYVVGASLLGATVSGVDADGKLTAGTAVTSDGLAPIKITYPANVGTIMTGHNPAMDTRVVPLNSARVYVVASSSDSSATTISNQFGFSPIAGFSLTSSVGSFTSSGTTTLELKDGGDKINVPFYPISAAVAAEALGTFPACVNFDAAISIEADCDALGGAYDWYPNRNYCIDRSVSKEDECTATSHAWLAEVPTTFDVDAYIGNSTQAADMVASFTTSVDTDLDGIDDFFLYPVTRSGGTTSARIMVRGTDWSVSGDTYIVTFVAGDASTSVTVFVP